MLEAANAVTQDALPEFIVPLTVPKPRVQPVPNTKPVHEVSPMFPVMTVSAKLVAGLVTWVVASTAYVAAAPRMSARALTARRPTTETNISIHMRRLPIFDSHLRPILMRRECPPTIKATP